jgi:hypothetical protein
MRCPVGIESSEAAAMAKPTIYLDAMIFDKILDDPRQGEIVEKLTQKYEVLISVINLNETGMAAGRKGERLRGLMTQLMGDLRLIKSPEDILRSALRGLEAGSGNVSICEPVTAAELQNYFSSEAGLESQIEEQRKRNRQSRSEQREFTREARQDMADMGVPVEDARKEPSSRSGTRFIKSLSQQPGFVQDRLAQLIKLADGTEEQIAGTSEIAKKSDSTNT